MRRALPVWLTIAWAGLLVVPWYGLDEGNSPPALLAGRAWLWPLAAPLLLATWAAFGRARRQRNKGAEEEDYSPPPLEGGGWGEGSPSRASVRPSAKPLP